MGASLTELFQATQATFNSFYVNDFNRDGRTYQVQLQAEGAARVRSKTCALCPRVPIMASLYRSIRW